MRNQARKHDPSAYRPGPLGTPVARPTAGRGAAASSGGRGAAVRADRTAGAPVTVGVVSDPHFGSRFCRREAIRRHIATCKAAGASLIVLPGDLVDGEYDDHGRFEGSVVGLDAQVDDMLDTIEPDPTVIKAFILGNHCETYWNKVGANVGRSVLGAATQRGRGSEFLYLGDRFGRVVHQGLIIDLWHPGGGKPKIAYSKLEARAQGYARGQEPDLLFAGHWHTFGHFRSPGRKVHMFGCPTFQGSGSAYGNSFDAPQDVGGLLVSAVRGDNGPRHVASAFFEIE